MATQLLKDSSISKAKPENKDKRLNDGDGLYLLIKPHGGKWWRLDYTIEGKRKTLSLGTYPDTGLADARRKANTARRLVADGTDPSETRKQTKEAAKKAAEDAKRLEAGILWKTALRPWRESGWIR